MTFLTFFIESKTFSFKLAAEDFWIISLFKMTEIEATKAKADSCMFWLIEFFSLQACISSVVFASGKIQEKKSKFDGQLFLIKHLLILREQIAPFNIINSSSETSLDFSAMTRNNLSSLDGLIKNALPEVKEFHLDYRREVDRLLKVTCEQFIQESAFACVASISVILNKEIIQKSSAASLNEKVLDSMKNVKKVIPLVQQKMSLYLANKETEFILFKPIRVNILESFGQFNKLIEETFDEQDLIVIGCPNMDVISVTLSSLSMTK